MFNRNNAPIDQDFQLFLDAERSIPTGYNRDAAYLKTHVPRIQRSYSAVRKYAGKGSQVLDVGGSPFYLAYLLSKYDKADVDVMFYSRDPHELQHSSAAYYDGGQINLFFKDIAENSSAVDYPDKQYDLIVFMECLEHLDYFPFTFLEYVKRSLKVGGVFYLTTPNACASLGLIRLALGNTLYHPYRPDPCGRHKFEYTRTGLLNVVRDCMGLEVIKARCFSAGRRNLFYRFASLGGMFTSRLPFMEVIARKRDGNDKVDWSLLSNTIYHDHASLEC